MKINATDLQKIAHLARLDLKPSDEAAMISSMESVLSWMEQLNTIDTSDIEPLTHISTELNVLRTDEVGAHLDRTAALSNAPAQNDPYFSVPKVIE